MADPVPAHTVYEFAKDFQPTFAAVIALTAAAIAYCGVVARISYERRIAEAARQNMRLSLCTRLKFQVKPFVNLAEFLVYWLNHQAVSVEEIEEQMTIWPSTPGEFDEAWQHVDALPFEAIEPLNNLRQLCERMTRVLGLSKEEKVNWFRIHVSAISGISKEIIHHANELTKALDDEIAALRKAADRFRQPSILDVVWPFRRL